MENTAILACIKSFGKSFGCAEYLNFQFISDERS